MQEDEKAIRELVARWMAATKAHDTDTVLSLMTEDVVFLTPGNPPMVGRDGFAAAAKAQAEGAAPTFDGTSEVQEIRVLGEWAWMWTRLKVVTTTPDGKTSTRAGHTLSVLRKRDGRWQLARDANLLAPAADKG